MKESLRATMRVTLLSALLVWGLMGVTLAQVSVTATAGTTGPTPYTTLNDAFLAINAGTHQGAIVIEISANTTETGPCVLNSSDAAPASYTSVLIRPSADGVSVSAATATGRGVIELKGADNVTIDGDNPNTVGNNRNLSIINTAAATVTYTSCVRVATAANVTSANNISIKNLILTGSATGRNASGNTSGSGSENTTFGIYVGGNGGSTATDAPIAVTSVTTNSAPSGTTVNSLLVDNNEISACARAVVFNGAATSVSTGVTITANIIGGSGSLTGSAPYTSPATTVYTKGIWVNGTTAVTISANTIQNILSYVGTGMSAIELAGAIGTGTITIANNSIDGVVQNANNSNSVKAILVSNAGAPYSITGNTVNNVQWVGGSATTGQQLSAIEVATTAASGTIQLNRISKIYNVNTGTWGVYGINLVGGNNIAVRNNFVSDINRDITGGSGFSATYGLFGIRVSSGTGHQIVYNSVNLSGAHLGASATSLLSAALALTSTSSTGVTIQNNLLSNTMTGGSTSIAHVALYLPSGATSTLNATINNNFYYCGTDAARQGIAQAGTTAGTNFFLPANFNAAATTPATNLRAYTSPLSAAGTNDNASYASTNAAPFVSTTNLHIDAASPNAVTIDGKAAVLSVTTDIDGDTRNATTPDIGADEFDLLPCSTAAGGTITPATYTRCAGQSAVLTSVGATTGSGITYQWKGALTSGGPYIVIPGGSGANTTTYTTPTLSAGTFYAVLEVTCANGPVVANSNEVAITVNPLPTAAVSPASATYCQGGAAVSLTASGGTTYAWSPGTGLSATSGATVTANPSASTTYVVTVTDANSCSATASSIITSSPGVNGAAASATPTVVCSGSTTALNATASPYTTTILSENFNSGAPAWTRVNNSVGGTIANAAWTDRPNNYVYGSNTFSSNDATQFVMSNSDAQDVVSGSTTKTELVSPAFSTVGITGLSLNFFHFYRHISAATDSASVEASTDGTNWTLITTYKTTTGAAGAFASATLALPVAFENQPTVYVRFRYAASWAWYWAIDNVSVTGGSTSYTYNWTSTPAGFTSTAQNPTATVSANTDFNVTISNPFGCSATAAASVTTLAGVTGATATASETEICAGASVNLNATYTATPVTLLVEKFNSGAPAWTRTNNSTGGTPADAAWTDRPDGYSYNSGPAYHSNDNSQFVQSNSDDQGLGSVTESILTSPAFSSTGNANLALQFYHYYRDIEAGSDSAIVQASTDGTNWTTVAVFDATVGTATAFAAANVNLPATFNNQATVYVRFKYNAEWAWYWSIDNVSITADAGINDYSWTSNPAGFNSTSQSATVTPTTTTEYTVVITNPSSGCTDTASVTVTVNSLPSVAVSPTSANYCNPGTGVALTASGAVTYAWSPASSLSAATGSAVTATPDATTVYTVTGTDANGCSATASTSVTSSPSVTNATAGVSAAAICPGGTIDLTSSADPVSSVILSESFNNSSNGWTITNNSTGGTNPAAAAWTYQPDGFDYDGTPYHSNDNTQFIQANSDVQGSGGTTNTSITSPAINTTGLSQIAVKFYHYYNDIGDNGDSAIVEASLDGTNWQIAGVYQAEIGAEDNFALSTVSLPATFNNQAAIYVRFRYKGTWDWYWSIDNVSVLGSSPNFTYSWSSNPAGFTSTDQNPTGVAPAVTTDYTVTITAPGGCTATATTTVSVNAVLPVSVTPSPATYCLGGIPVALTASGAVTYSWSPATDLSATTGTTVNASPSATAVYTVTGTDNVGCTGTASVTVSVTSGSTGATVTASATDICAGSSVTLNATGTSGITTLLSENFNSGAPAWTRENLSTGGTTAAAAWANRPDGYSYAGGTPYHSNDNTQFVQSNSDAQGSGGSTLTRLVSPSFSTIGQTSVNLKFYHYYEDINDTGDSAVVEASLDGVNWTILNAYTASVGSEDAFAQAIINLPPTFENQPSVRIRFRYRATYDWYWSIDNVSVNAGTIPYNYSWSSDPAGFTGNTGNVTATPTQTTTYTVSVADQTIGCVSTASVTVNVNPLPVVTATASSAAYCGTPVTLTADGASTYTWSPAAGLSATTGTSVDASPSANTTYVVTGTDANGCSATATVSVNAPGAVTGVTASASETTICEGETIDLSSTGTSQTVILRENFNSGATNWTRINNSTGGTIANAAWIDREDGYIYSSNTYRSNDSTQFVMSNSDNQNSGTTSTILVSPVFSTTGLDSVKLDFYHYYRDVADAGDTAIIEASLDGTTWQIVQIYTATVGNFNAFAPANVLLPATYSNQATVSIRFRYKATWDWYWAVDNVQLSGNYTDLTYSWTSNPAGFTSTDQNPLGVAPAETTEYIVTVSNPGGCSSTASVIVNVNAAPDVVANASFTSICTGDQVNLTGSGATTYSWSGGISDGVAFVPNGTDTYTVTGTDGNGCSASASVTVTVNPIPVVTASASSSTICAGEQVTLSGGGATTYSWNGGVTDGVAFTPNATDTYTVTGTSNGCSATASVTVAVNDAPSVTASSTSSAICAGEQIALTGGGATTYSWSGGVTDGVAFAPNATDTYTVTGTDGNGCSASATVSVTVNNTPSVSANASSTSLCAGDQVTLTGGGATTYSWSGSVTDGVAFTPNATDTYTVTGTDGNGCSATASVTVTVNNIPSVSASASSSIVCAGEQVTLTGSGAATYSWSGSVTDGVAFAPNATDTYTVTGTDGNGCSATASVTVAVNTAPSVTASTSSSTVCAGSQVTLTGGGAATYSWSGSVTDGVAFTPNATDTYTVTGTDGNGCSATASVTVAVNNAPSVTANASSSDVCAGSQVTLTGGGATTYSWSGSVTDGVAFTPNATDTYTITGTDGNGCSASASVTVAVNNAPSVTASASSSALCAGSQVTLTGGGATAYSWSGSVTDGVAFTPNATDTYTVTGTDGNGCSATASVTVVVNTVPSVTASASTSAVCAGSQVTLTGGGATTYSWSGSVTDGVAFTPNATATYTVTGTDGNGCSATASVSVAVNSAPNVSLSLPVDTVELNGGNVALSGGSPAGGTYTGIGVSGTTFNPTVNGLGSVTITYAYTDGNGCSGTATDNIVVVNTVGIVNVSVLSGVQIFPNPNQGQFVISLNAATDKAVVVEITDATGRLVDTFAMTNKTQQVNIDSYAAGVYFVRLSYGEARTTQRVIKQ